LESGPSFKLATGVREVYGIIVRARQALGYPASGPESVMAGETPTDPGQAAVERGQRIGIWVGLLTWFVLREVLELKFELRIDRKWGYPFLFVGILGGATVGGVVQLYRQGRRSEIGQFLLKELRGILVIALAFLVAWVSQEYYGDVGWWCGFLGFCALAVVVRLLVRWVRGRPRAQP
jgi:hypothetical protein